MSSDAVVDQLAAMSVFESVPRADLEWLAAHGEMRTLPSGSVFFNSTESIEEMYVLIAGRLMLRMDTKTGGSRTLLRAGAGRVLGASVSDFSRARPAAVNAGFSAPMVLDGEKQGACVHHRRPSAFV